MKRRLFIALNLPEELKDSIEREVEKIRYQFTDDIRFTDRKQWHVTITFLGYQNDETINSIIKSMNDVCGHFQPPTVEFSDINYGPKKGTPRMIWLNGNLKSSRNLQKLKDDLENKLVDNGVVFKREHRQLSVHLTLARLVTGKNLLPLNLPFKNHIEIPTLDLMESRLARKDADYELLQATNFQI